MKPDLVIIDYVDLDGSLRNELRDTEGTKLMIFILALKDLARELNIPIWSVSQVNRAGAKDDVSLKVTKQPVLMIKS